MYIGCEGWSDFLAITGFDFPEPERVVVVSLEQREDDDGDGDVYKSVNVLAVWQEGDRFRWINTCLDVTPANREQFLVNWLKDFLPETLQDREQTHRDLMCWVKPLRLWNAGLREEAIDDARVVAVFESLAQEIENEMRRDGIRLLYTVQASGGEYDDHWNLTEAVYDDIGLAVAHAKAAKRHQKANPPESRYDEAYFGVGWLLHRTSLPAALQAYATDGADPDTDDDACGGDDHISCPLCEALERTGGKVPNAQTRAAMEEARDLGVTASFTSIAEFFDDLNSPI